MAEQHWVDYAFWLEILPARARKSRFNRLKGTVPVEIAEVAAFENPKALVDAYDREPRQFGGPYSKPSVRKGIWTKANRSIGPSEAPGKETVTTWCAGHEGRLWRPIQSPVRKEEFCTVAALLASGNDEDFKDNPFVMKRDRGRMNLLKTRDDILDMKVKEVRTDTEEADIARVLRTARDLVTVDGKLWRAQAEPVFVVERRPGGVVISYDRPYRTANMTGVAFPADRYPEALAFAQAFDASLVGRKRPVEEPYRKVISADPAFLSLNMAACSAKLLGQATLAMANEYRNGPSSTVAEGIREALGNEERGVDVARLVGDPYAFSERLGEWADDVRSLPRHSSFDGVGLDRFEDGLRRLAEPFVFGREYGLGATATDSLDFMTQADLDFLASLDDPDFGPSP